MSLSNDTLTHSQAIVSLYPPQCGLGVPSEIPLEIPKCGICYESFTEDEYDVKPWYNWCQINHLDLTQVDQRMQAWYLYSSSTAIPCSTLTLSCTHTWHVSCFSTYVLSTVWSLIKKVGEPTTKPYEPQYNGWCVWPSAPIIKCPLCRQPLGLSYVSGEIYRQWPTGCQYWCYDQAYSPEHPEAGSWVRCDRIFYKDEHWYAQVTDVITHHQSLYVPIICLFDISLWPTLPRRSDVAQRLYYLGYTQTLYEGEPSTITKTPWWDYARAYRNWQRHLYISEIQWPSSWFTQRFKKKNLSEAISKIRVQDPE